AGLTQTYQGKYAQDNYNLNEITNDLIVSLSHDFNENFKIYGDIGHNFRQRLLTQSNTQTNEQGGLAIDDYYNLENSNGPAVDYNRLYLRRLIGVYADANVAIKNMVFIGVTGRNDWSSTLPSNKRSFFYPSANASFVMSELFKQEFKNKYISYAKLRASAAQVGNDAGPYLEKTLYEKGDLSGLSWGSTTLPFNGINGYSVANLIGNPDIKPEITTGLEAGLEMNFFKDRIGFDFAVYKQSSKDQIITLPLPASTGYTGKTINAGVIENKGVELMLRGTPLLTADWKLDLIVTYTKNISDVISLSEGVDQITLGGFANLGIVAAPGHPYGTFYGQDYKRDPQGNVVVDPATGLPILSTTSVYFGSYNPDFQASIRANLVYKGLTFGILFDGKKGGQFYSNTRSLMSFVGTSAETAEGGRDPRVWENSVVETSPGVFVPNTTPYSPYDLNANQANRAVSMNLVDASYIKLREVSLSYRLPAKWFDKTPLGAVAVGLFGNNLLLFTPKENKYADPEINASGNGNAQGFEYTSIPSQRNFGFNIKVNF
ncbi:MAG TPA: TonB-dependent receptor, partial [Bacteroidia bacterium]|nr:TonB-dependent receptor [Bacteroidia bacterium]